MTAKRASLVLVFLVALVLASPPIPAAAQRRGGGSHGGGGGYRGGGGHGGGYHGGGHAVPRGSAYHSGARYGGHGGHSHGGHYGHSGHYGHRGYYGGHGHAYYGYGRGYYGHYYGYPYRYYPYGSAWFYGGWPYAYGVSIGIGASYGYSASPVYGNAYAAPAVETEMTYDAPPVTRTRNDDSGRVRIAVTPADASLYVDDEYWGNARQIRSLTLRAGQHTIDVVRPGFAPVRQEVRVVSGEMSELRVELQRP